MPRRSSRPRPRARRGTKKRGTKKQVGPSGLLVFLLLAVLGTAGVYWSYRTFLTQENGVRPPEGGLPADPEGATRRSPVGAAGDRPETSSDAASAPRPEPPSAPSPAPSAGGAGPALEVAPGDGARVAVVIDDLGRSLEDLRTLDALGVPLTYAVLPFESQTAAVTAELRRRRREILLHLPMEPANGANPGPGALTRAMDRKTLERATRAALAAVPGAVGVNNHMGSGLSADAAAMHAVLGVLARRDLFFLDSRTSADTVAYRVAGTLGIPAAERQVFLDRDPDPEAIAYQFRRLLALSRERGSAIAIGHPYPETLAVLSREVPRAVEMGYEMVPVSFLVQRAGELPE